MFELKSVTKSFSGTPAVMDLDLEVPRGRTTVLIGPSGCGKSTVLRLMNGLLEPTAGEVRFDGAQVDGAPVGGGDEVAGLRHRMGYVIQSGGLFPHLTARDNVALLARDLGRPGPEIDARLDELAALARIDAEHWDRFPLQLSGGQRQRIALARALMLDPEVLLLDEPLGALDPIVRAELQDELKSTIEALDKTVVLVTHDLAEAEFFADTVVLMRDGRIVQQGTVRDLEESPVDEFVTRFVRAQTRSVER